MAGANAVFTGEKMLTTDCNGWDEDRVMFERWGFYPMRSFEKGTSAVTPQQEVEPVAQESEKVSAAPAAGAL
jgi:biotin synthase